LQKVIAMLEWSEAKAAALAKWYRLRERVGVIDLKTFLDEASEACPFCADAAAKKQEAEEAGVRVRVQCVLCEVYNRYGSCHERIDAGMNAAVAEDWDRAGAAIDDVIAWVEAMSPGSFGESPSELATTAAG